MSWLRIDDGFVENHKVEQISDRAFRLHVAALCHCARNLTDGQVSDKARKTLLIVVSASNKHVSELVSAGLWLKTEAGYVIKDYLEYNPDAATVKEQRARNAERQRDVRKRRNEVRHEVEASVRAAERNDVRNGVRVGGRNAAPTPTPALNPKSVSSNPSSTKDVGMDARASGERQTRVDRVLAACGRHDADSWAKVHRAGKGCSEADFVAAIEAASSPKAQDKLAVALSVLAKRKKVHA